ncbi:YcfL family protein [Inhella crocodyli]|uniref:DUF1425 domain-containing protein n=1 Tax=Inhella crocodyli TaxID=2499851 RepID=A0A3S2WU43_9BURK|nr:YcfL family protein [Inhella crocodyli]RVT87945.1 DUF1425 domain-containing protein [Inhella crocodyli]
MKTFPWVRTAATAVTAAAALAMAQPVWAADDTTSPAIAAKLALRGEPQGIKVAEVRMQRKADVLVVQADFLNTKNQNRTVFYRFRWLDADGNVVGDGESWKQLQVYGQQTQTIKGVAAHSSVVDFRIEMNVEKN